MPASASPADRSLAQQAAPITFVDRFSDGTSGWTSGDGRYLDADGYHLDFGHKEQGTLFTAQAIGAPRAADVAFEATLQLLSGPDTFGYGIAIRATNNPLWGYRLYINGRGSFSLFRRTPEAQTPLISWRRSEAVRPGEPNTLRLVSRGTTLSAFINGEQVGWVQDAAVPEEGALQLVVNGGQHVLATWASATTPTDQELARPLVTAPIFRDYFFDNRERWPASDTRYFDDDGYHMLIEARETRGVFSVFPGGSPSVADASVEAELQLAQGVESRGFGIAMRRNAQEGNNYRLFINAEGSFMLDKVVANAVTSIIPWSRSGALKPGIGVINKVKLVARGSNLLVYLNGQLAGNVKDESIGAAGTIALTAYDGQHVIARSIIATDPTEDELAPLRPAATPTPQPAAGALRAAIVAAWEDYASPGNGFGIKFPRGIPPVTQQVSGEGRFGTVKTVNHFVRVTQGDAVVAQFQIGYSSYPDAQVAASPPEAFLNATRDNVVSSVQGTLISDQAITIDGVPGREFIVALPGGVVAKSRAVFASKRVYLAVAIVAAQALNLPPDVDFFLGSLKITPLGVPPPATV